MFAFTQPHFWALFFTTFRCHHCGSFEGYASRPRNFVEGYLLRVFLLRPARCADCYRRSWRPARVPLMSRRDDIRIHASEALGSGVAQCRETNKETQTQPDAPQHIA